MTSTPPANWYPDPAGNHQFRYWDGATWTHHAADNGVQVIDPLLTPNASAAQLTRREVRKLARDAEADQLRRKHEDAARQRLAIQQEAHARAQREHEERELERRRSEARHREQRQAAEREAEAARDFEARILRAPAYYLPEYNGYPSTEVAGEFARIGAIHKVLGRAPKLDEELIDDALTVTFVPEPSNPHDKNAVKVVIKGHHVGYLEKEVAAVVYPIFREIVDAGYAPVAGARVWAVARRDYDSPRKLRHHANVRVALTHTHLILPINDPPPEDYSVLPSGGSLQVTGEEHHQDVLSNYVTSNGDALVVGTLVPMRTARANAKDLVEIRIDGERIGQLTPGSSQHFLPAIWHLDAQGMTTAAWLRVKGSAIAAQVTIHATRAHELPTNWFEAAHTIPRLHGSAAIVPEASVDDGEIRAAMREPMWDEPG